MTLVWTLGKVVLKNYGTPAAIAGIAPTLDYRFALDRNELDAVTLTDKLTLTRAATASFTNLGGNLELATANVPRFDHSPSTRQSLGLLVEEARTNLALNSEDFGGAPWIRNQTTVTTNAAVSPTGATTADSLLETTANAEHTIYAPSSSTLTTATQSFYVKPNGRTNVGLRFFHDVGDWVSTVFSLTGSGSVTQSSAGSISNFSAVSSSITNAGNGWYRISMTGTQPSQGTYWAVLNLCTSSTPTLDTINGSELYAGNVTKGVYVWGAQLEAGAFPTSYIPTTTATVTRTETATVSLAGLPVTRTLVEKPVGCATVAGDTLTLNAGYTAERVMIFPTALTGTQITAIRGAM